MSKAGGLAHRCFEHLLCPLDPLPHHALSRGSVEAVAHAAEERPLRRGEGAARKGARLERVVVLEHGGDARDEVGRCELRVAI